MKGPWGLIQGVVCPLGVVWLGINRFVRSDVRVAEKISGRDHDVAECRDVIDGSEVILRSLCVVRGFTTVSDGKRERADGRRLLRCHFLFPFSVLTQAE